GNLLSWEINVTKPYTGSASSYTCLVCMFGFAVTSGGVFYPIFVNQVSNLKVRGIRTITASNTSAPLSGDTLVAAPFWLSGGHTVQIGPVADGTDTLGMMPKLVMTAHTDQGFAASETVNTRESGNDTLTDGITHGGTDNIIPFISGGVTGFSTDDAVINGYTLSNSNMTAA